MTFRLLAALLVLALAGETLRAQDGAPAADDALPEANPPDWAALEARFAGPDGPAALDALAAELASGRPTLAQAQALYYGSRWLPSAGDRDDFRAEALLPLVNRADAPSLLARCDSVLGLRPADLTAHYYKGLALFLLDTNDARAAWHRDRYELLCNTILSSGTGASCPSAFHVLAEADALEVLRFLAVRKATPDPIEGAPDCLRYRITASPIYRSRVAHFRLP
jgi:hypothetical protein